MTQESSPRRRTNLQRGVIILPSSMTLGNLFFGIFAMVAAARGDFIWAGWCIVFAAVLDLFDGRVARFTRTGSAFGGELDSLVDAISFGVAPAVIMYHLFFSEPGWNWIISFVYVTAVVLRLARFNVEQGGEAKKHFHGLPSPTAGMILATYYPFSQTQLYQQFMGELPWQQVMGVIMVLLSVLMVSHIPYVQVPKIDIRTRRGVFVVVLMLATAAAAISVPHYFFFPVLILYTLWGMMRSFTLGLLERLPERDPLLDEEDDEAIESRTLDYDDIAPRGRKSR